MRQRRRILLASAAAVVALGTALMMTLPGSATASMRNPAHAARPHSVTQSRTVRAKTGPTLYPVTAVTQEFGSNDIPFCPPAATPPNAPCDGNWTTGDYGTIDRVATGFSNGGYGNYAPFTKALVGHFMAVVSGTEDVNLNPLDPGTAAGCANPTEDEACTGPYALFGTGAALGAENEFPTGGFTITNDLYLDPNTMPVGQSINDDIGLNLSAAESETIYSTYSGYGQDIPIGVCNTGSGIAVNFSVGADAAPCSAVSGPITTAGWYRFVFVFSDTSGNVLVTESVWQEASNPTQAPTLIAAAGATPVTSSYAVPGSNPVTYAPISSAVANWGGPLYFWLYNENVSGLPLANFALQLGEHAQGHTP